MRKKAFSIRVQSLNHGHIPLEARTTGRKIRVVHWIWQQSVNISRLWQHKYLLRSAFWGWLAAGHFADAKSPYKSVFQPLPWDMWLWLPAPIRVFYSYQGDSARNISLHSSCCPYHIAFTWSLNDQSHGEVQVCVFAISCYKYAVRNDTDFLVRTANAALRGKFSVRGDLTRFDLIDLKWVVRTCQQSNAKRKIHAVLLADMIRWNPRQNTGAWNIGLRELQ